MPPAARTRGTRHAPGASVTSPALAAPLPPTDYELSATPRASDADEVSRAANLRDYSFQPRTIEAPAGALVTLTVVKGGNHEHAWVLMERDCTWGDAVDADDSGHGIFRITVDVLGQDIAQFTAPSVPGEYNIVCSIVGHVERGMVGTLIVRKWRVVGGRWTADAGAKTWPTALASPTTGDD